MSTSPEVEIALKGRPPGRPPMKRMVVDLTLHNTDSEARWFALPAHSEGWADKLAVDGVEPSSVGTIVVGSFQGTGAFVALRLAPHADVVVRNLQLSSASTVSHIDVRIARSIRVGGKPAEAWFPADPTTASGTADFAERSALASQHTPDRSEVPVELDVVRSIVVPVR